MITVLVIEDDYSTRLVTKLHLKNEYNVVEKHWRSWNIRKQIWSLQM